MRRIYEILSAQSWIFAKSMPQNPHEYCLRRNFINDEDFVFAVKYIRENGVEYVFGGRRYIVFNMNGYRYWTMGAPINNADGSHLTILINRAKNQPQSSDYDGIANEYELMFSSGQYKTEDSRLFDILRPFIRGRVLDIGCGTGLFLDHCKPEGYVGMDCSRDMLGILKQKHPDANVIHDNFEDTYTGQYDTIVALYGTASYFSDKAQIRILEHLTPGGFYFLMVYKDDYYPVTHKHFGIEYRPSGFTMPDANVYEFGNYIIYTNAVLSQK